MKTETVVAVDVRCDIGECPLWDEDTKTLYFIDLMKNCLHVYKADNSMLKTVDMRQNTGAVALRKKGGLIAALQRGIFFLDPDTGNLELIASPEKDLENNRFNDGKCDPAGRFWAGTMSKTLDSGFGEYTPLGALYCVDADLICRKMLDRVTISNGLAWTADARTMYYIDSPTKVLSAFDYNPETGEILNRRAAMDFSEYDGIPDGMCIDSKDHLWIAFYGGGCLRYCDPVAGVVLDVLPLPVPNVTCAGFGGKDYRELYITTGYNSTDIKQYPLAGAVFKAVPDVPGLPHVKFNG